MNHNISFGLITSVRDFSRTLPESIKAWFEVKRENADSVQFIFKNIGAVDLKFLKVSIVIALSNEEI